MSDNLAEERSSVSNEDLTSLLEQLDRMNFPLEVDYALTSLTPEQESLIEEHNHKIQRRELDCPTLWKPD